MKKACLSIRYADDAMLALAQRSTSVTWDNSYMFQRRSISLIRLQLQHMV
jgi:hypothetical protein